jgi:hypothetical protein
MAGRALLAAVFLAAFNSPCFSLDFFGYVAVACGHDDPFDTTDKTDFSDEVVGFTNANHVCLPEDPALWSATLARTAAQYDPVLSVEGLFDFGPVGGGPDGAVSQQLWKTFTNALDQSGVPPERLYFYLADEPTLRGIPADQIARAGDIVHQTYPNARTMLVEAYRAEGPSPVAESVDFWGFDAYAIPDPGAEPLYLAYLNAARRLLHPGQRIVVILDAQHTPMHAQAGLSADDMADVALATYAFVRTQPDVAGILGYTWAGGIDNLEERGLRDLSPAVRAVHEQIGRDILVGSGN